MILKPSPVSSAHFMFKDNKFVAELSQFGDLRLERVYDDAADFGFSIISERTGNHAVFALDRYEYTGDNELEAIHFVCVTPKLKHLKAVLFND